MNKKTFFVFLLVFGIGITAHANIIKQVNVVINAFRIVDGFDRTVSPMNNGVVDAFNDAKGIDASLSTNIVRGDQSTLLLHFNGADGDTTTTNDGSNNEMITFLSDAQIDTNERQFGNASLELDGIDDSVTIENSSDWDIVASTTENWTIDMWVKMDNPLDNVILTMLAHLQTNGERYSFIYCGSIAGSCSTHGFRFFVRSDSNGGILFDTRTGIPIDDNEWHHVALVKLGTVYAIYVDGQQQSYDTFSFPVDFTGKLHIGEYGLGADFFDGHIDELRIVKSNIFNATPDNLETDEIIVPPAENKGAFYMPSPGTNMTITSGTFIADSPPNRATITLFTENVDPNNIASSISVGVSSDGMTFQDITGNLESKGQFENGYFILKGSRNVAASDIMKYQITTINNEPVKIHGVGYFWE